MLNKKENWRQTCFTLCLFALTLQLNLLESFLITWWSPTRTQTLYGSTNVKYFPPTWLDDVTEVSQAYLQLRSACNAVNYQPHSVILFYVGSLTCFKLSVYQHLLLPPSSARSTLTLALLSCKLFFVPAAFFCLCFIPPSVFLLLFSSFSLDDSNLK